MSEAALLARIAVLETKLDDLVREVERLRAARHASMAQLQRCPACGGPLFHFTNIRERSHHGSLTDFTLHKMETFWSAKDRAPLEAYACRSCGLVEWHAKELSAVEPATDALAIDPPADALPPSDGPFR
jgi:hypothetical protein